tara:strand:+ start:13685 stop:13966 length:282 start_codon:yes stop_codon:yes gene_type:complete
MFEYLIIDTDGEETHVESKEKPDLYKMQEMVDGNIELVVCRYEDGNKHMIINEEGKLKNLDVNPKATKMYLDLHNVNDTINGKAIVFKNFEID